MFRKSQPSTQPELFKGLSNAVSGKKAKALEDPDAWHNVFYREVTSQIDESPFQVLYSEKMGRPNASVRQLLAMTILKEGMGWTDRQLFDEVQFNLKVMKALGLQNIDEEAPSDTTYYDFRSRLNRYFEEHQIDLIGVAFRQVTIRQVNKYEVKGDHLRMDSKLIQSNIANCCRLQLIYSTVRSFYLSLSESGKQKVRKEYYRELLDLIAQHQPSNLVYELVAEEKAERIDRLGHLIRKLLNLYTVKDTDQYDLLLRLYKEQYDTSSKDDDAPTPKDKTESNTVQSPHDPDATYRKKGQGKNQKQIHGYHANITDTYDPNGLNLIVQTQVARAHISENDFLQPALEESQEVLDQFISFISADGGYDSVSSRAFIVEAPQQPVWLLKTPKGGDYTFHFSYNEAGELEATDLRTGEPCEVKWSEQAQKYAIKTKRKGKQAQREQVRYVDKVYIQNYFNWQHIKERMAPHEDKLHIRANVESTIHQVFCKGLNGDQSRYRGMLKHKIYVYCRALWTNVVRIQKYTKGINPKQALEQAINGLFNWIWTNTRTILTDIGRHYNLANIQLSVSIRF